MSGERTEAATPKRRQDARKKGQISKSQDFNSALMIIVGVSLLSVFSPAIMQKIQDNLKFTFTNLNPQYLDENNLIGLLIPYAKLLGEVALPFLVILMFAGIFIIRMQVGSLFTLEPIKPKLDKLMPSAMLKKLKDMFNIADPKKIFELGKSLIKMVIVGAVGFSVLSSRKEEILQLLGADLHVSYAVITSIISQMVVDMCLAMLFIGFVDKKYQNYQYEKSLKMTKEEIKDERKNSEGDPTIKSKIKAFQMKFATQRMMTQIPTANVIVTNPTHYAVAIRYDVLKAPAPQVVAKGVDFMAFKIKEIAENNKIPIIENKPLARTLYKIVPLDGIIPAELYVAVAEVLAYVYNKTKGKR